MAARNSSAVEAFSTRGMVSMRAASQSMGLPSGGATIQGWKNLTVPQTRQRDSRRAIWLGVSGAVSAASEHLANERSKKLTQKHRGTEIRIMATTLRNQRNESPRRVF